ncbi:MAG TPA: hypothetical protein VMJ66_02950 [Geobacteraceae bacterium]|nr:hypothetical protein [Geobacteraceae bacterium]
MSRINRNCFYLLFALSGFSGLIYESVWTHYLKLFLGHAAYAQTLVLAIFMGGMAIGSWLCSRYSSRWRNMFAGYALAECVIGLCALLFHDAFARTIELSYTSVIPMMGNPTAVSLFKWSISALMILPQTVLLGMTFPLMSAGIIRMFPRKPGRTIAMLYFTNSIGAAVGVLVSGFMLIRLVGLPGTIRIAGVINIALALTVWFLVRGHSGETQVADTAGEAPSRYTGKGWFRFLLFASLLTGTASFIYEIGWIRMLSLVLGSSTHAFELMLSAFIFGLAFGGLWVQRRIDQSSRPVRFLAQVQFIMGLLALSTLLLYGNTFGVMQWILNSLSRTDTGYALFNLSSNAIAMAIMLPTTFCAGMTLPLITFVLLREGHGERSIGAVYSANTIGAIAGVFFAIHLGLPFLGIKGLIVFGAGLDIALGVALAWSAAADFRGRFMPAALTAAALVAVGASLAFVKLDPYKMSSGVYRTGHLLDPGKVSLLYYRDGKTATVSLYRELNGQVTIATNGKIDASVMMAKGSGTNLDEATQTLLGAIPMVFNPRAKTAAAIGLGSGVTVNTLLSDPLMKEVDTIEIEQRMVEAANNFRPRVELVFTDPRSRIHIDDAKTFFSTYNRRYNLIVSEPSNPWVSGVAGLFSDEFYRLVRRHINDDGLFVQWVQLYEINMDLVASVLKAVAVNFSDYAVYAPNDVDIIIIARKKGMLPDPDPGLWTIPAIAGELRRIHVESLQDLELRKVGSRRAFGRLLDAMPIRANSDYYPVLDQNAAKTRFLDSNAFELVEFAHALLPSLELLTGTAPAWQHTDITPSRYFQPSQAAYTAMALRDFFLHGNFDPHYYFVPEEIKQSAARVRELFFSRLPVTDQQEFVSSLFVTAVAMTPYLTPSELAATWKVLESGPNAGSLAAPIRRCVNLLEAVGRRDAAAMAKDARLLLTGPDRFSPGAEKYFLAVGMMGNLMEGDREESFRLWSGYGAAVFGKGEPDLLFRILVAESRQ